MALEVHGDNPEVVRQLKQALNIFSPGVGSSSDGPAQLINDTNFSAKPQLKVSTTTSTGSPGNQRESSSKSKSDSLGSSRASFHSLSLRRK